MKMRRFGYVLLLVMLATCAMLITSCKNKNKEPEHTHSYTATVTNPTCTEKGYTTHKCSCGDFYVDTYVDAKGHALETVFAKESDCKNQGYSEYKKCKNCSYTEGKSDLPLGGHDYVVTIKQYPTAFEAGERELKCSVCGDTVVESIDAFSVSLPDVSEIIFAALNGAKYTLDASELELIRISEADGEEVDRGAFALKIAELVLDGTGEAAAGHLKLEIGLTREEDGEVTFESGLACYIYLNGDAVSVEITPPNQPKETYDFSLNEAFYTALANRHGSDGEDLMSGQYIMGELQKYLPVLGELMGTMPTISESFIEDLNAIAALVGEEIFTAESDDDGYTTYTLNIAALKAFLEIVDGKTVAEILDNVYGEGSSDALLAFISAIPEKTIGEIVDAAIALTENYEIPVEDTYYLVNLIIYHATGDAEFNIESLIDAYYDQTVVDLIVSISGMPEDTAAEFKVSFKEQLVGMVTMILGSTVDDLFNMFAPVDPEAEPISLIENLGMLIDMIDSMVSLDIVVDADGAFDSLSFATDLADGTLSLTAAKDEVDNVNVEIDFTQGELDLLDFGILVNSLNKPISMMLVIRDDRYVVNYVIDPETEEYVENYEYLDFGEVLSFGFSIIDSNPYLFGVSLKNYDEYAGELAEVLSFAVLHDATDAEHPFAAIKINDIIIEFEGDLSDAENGKFVYSIKNMEDETLASATVNVTKTFDEDGAVIHSTFTLNLTDEEEKNLLELKVVKDALEQSIEVYFVVCDDRYVINEVIDPETEEIVEEYEYLDFGPIFDFAVGVKSSDESIIAVYLNTYDEYAGEMTEDLMLALYHNATAEDDVRVGLIINDYVVTLEDTMTDENNGNLVIQVMNRDLELLSYIIMNYAKTVDEEGALIDATIEMDAVDEEGNDVLDLIFRADAVNSSMELDATLYGYSYDEEAEESIFGVLAVIGATLELEEGAAKLTVVATDKDSVELFNGTFVFSQTFEEDAQCKKVEYEITVGGETLVGEIDFDAAADEDGVIINRVISAALKDAEEELFLFSDATVVSENFSAYTIDLILAGETLIGGMVFADFVPEEGKETVRFGCNLDKIVQSIDWLVNPETEEFEKLVNYFTGAGLLTIMVER